MQRPLRSADEVRALAAHDVANWDGMGVNFAIFSASASGAELCLFGGAEDADETVRIQLAAVTLASENSPT